QAGSTITLYDTNGTSVLGTTTTNGLGKWSLTSTKLSEGKHALTAKAADLAGNSSSASTSLTVTIDTTAPSSTPGTPLLDAGSDSGSSSSDGITRNNTPTLNGSGVEAQGYVEIYVDSDPTPYEAFYVDGSGNWSGSLSSTLADGSHTIRVGEYDLAGNFNPTKSAGLTLAIDATNPAAPSALDLATGSDTGISSSDDNTNDTTPTISGKTEADATVTLYDSNGTTVLGTTTADGSGNWSITSTTLAEGSHTLTAKATDAVGNESTVSSALTVTIDTTAPTTTIATTKFSDDTGSSATDFITKTAAQTISGTTSANLVSGELVEVSLDNGVTWNTATTTVGANTWTLSSQTLAASNTLKVRVSDTAGNSGTVASQAYVLDQSAPSAPTTTLATASDSGTSSSDGVTSVTTPVISGTAEANASVTLYDTDGTTVLGTTTADGSGNWSITSATLSEANHTLTAKATDAAGNVSSASTDLELTIDVTAPGTPGTPDLDAGSDTGTSNSDNITKTTTPIFTGTAEANASVTLYDSNGTTVLGTATADGSGKWSITSSKLAEGEHTVSVKASDTAGNASVASSTLAVTVDTTSPTQPAAPTLATASDTGVSSSDGITTVNTLDFSGTTDALAIVNLFDTGGKIIIGTTTADSNGKWSVTTSSLTAALHNITVKTTDVAGNVSAASTAAAVTIDNTAPALSTAITISDTALKVGDTATVKFTFTEAVSGFTTADLVVEKGAVTSLSSSDGGITWTGTLTPTSNITDTTNMITLDNTGYTDLAGNAGVGTSNSPNYAIDTEAPTLVGSIMVSDTALKIDDTATVTVVFSEAVTGFIAADLKVPNGTLNALTTGDGGITWTATLTPNASVTAASNVLTLGLTGVTDLNGNAGVGSQDSVKYAVDTESPTLDITSDVSTLKIGETAVITFTFSEDPGGTFSWDGSSGDVVVNGGTLGAISGSGLTRTATFTPTASVDNGSASISVAAGTYTDAAGNSGKAASGNAPQYDTLAPDAPLALDLGSAEDSGASNSDNITNITSPTISGTAEANASVTLYDSNGTTVLGTATADNSGAWSIPSSKLSEGSHTLTAKATDAAGNIGAVSSALTVTIDTSAPTSTIATTTFSNDTGSSATDFITKTAAQTISGTTSANLVSGELVEVSLDNGTTWSTATTTVGANTWSLGSQTLSASNTLKVRVSDTAGNTGTAASQAYVLDQSAPSAPTTTLATASDSGTSNSDGVTNVTTPVISGKAEANASVTLYDTDGSTVLGTTSADGSGNWSITSSTLVDGSHSLTATATDTAGNVGKASSALTVTIDTSVPTTTIATTTFSNDTGSSATDFITKTAAQTISGTTSANLVSGELVEVSLDNGTTWSTATTTVGANTWSLGSQTLSANNTLKVRVSDTAGNTGTVASQAYVLDQSAPSAPTTTLASASDSGASSSDGVTSVTTPVIAGTAEANATVTLYDTDGSTVLGTTTADGSGNWLITSSTLADGGHTLTAKVSDTAGNVSSASSNLTIMIDATAPATPGVPDLASGSDTGASDSDNITPSTTPVFTGTAEANASVTLYDSNGTTVLGTATADNTGAWSITSATLADGEHMVSVKASDRAGNVSSASTALSVTVDNKAPTTPAAPTLAAGSDSGASSSDGVTNLNTLEFGGVTEASATVKLYDTDGSTVIGTTTADGSGNWSVTTSTLTAGAHSITVKATDAAGNVSSASQAASVTIDKTAPVLNGVISISDTALKVGETATVTFTFTEALDTDSFKVADVTVPNGTLQNLSSGDGGTTWTATLTQTASVTASSNLLTLDYSGILDAAGNAGTSTATSGNYAVDTVRPALASSITISDTALKIGDTATVTFTFTEALDVNSFTIADVTVPNGVLSNLTTSDGGITWTATLTPNASVTGATNVLTLDYTGVLDAAGNAGTGSATSGNYAVDTAPPVLASSMTISDTALKVGDTATVTFTFTEAVTGFTVADVTVPNGVLSNLTTSDGGITWTATLTPSATTTDATNVLTLDYAGVADLAGNAGSGTVDSANYAIDTTPPTVTAFTLSDTALISGDSAQVTITFSEAVSGLTAADLTIANSSLSNLATADGGVTWTATLSPQEDIQGDSTLTLNVTGVNDAAGNAGTGTSAVKYSIDTIHPTGTVSISSSAFKIGDSATVSVAFSQAVTGLASGALSAPGLTLGEAVSSDGGVTWSMTATPNPGQTSAGNAVTLNAGSVSSLSGNAGVGSASSSAYAIDTQGPTASVSLSRSTLTGGSTGTVTIAFSEAVSGFDLADMTAGNATLSGLASSDGGRTWTASLLADSGVTASGNIVSVNLAGVRDVVGNSGVGNASSGTYLVDVTPPVVGTVDGVTTVTTGVKDSVTGLDNTVVNVPIITSTRSDDPTTPNQTLADIPLGQSGAGGVKVDLTVSLPVGAGLQVEGANQLLNKDQALLDLINRIEQKTPSGSSVQQEMTGQGRDFLQTLGTELVQSKTLVPTATSGTGTGTGAKILITGNSSGAPGDTDGGAIGLVIDTRQLPSNAQLTLNNVDFAAIVGNATLRGGDGRNFVIGDSGTQNIFLGADDDLLFGGAGNDIIGSAGGNDTLDGGADNDTVIGGIGNDSVSGGSGNDILGGGRSDAGQWQVFLNNAGKFVAKHETSLFAPGQWETVQASELAASLPEFGFLGGQLAQVRELAQLYDAAFDRPADFAGLSYWVGTGSDVLAMAGQFLQGAEWRDAGGVQLSNAAFVDKVYRQALDRAPEAAGAAYWTGLLEGKDGITLSRAEVLKMIALSPEHVGLLSNADGMKVAAATVTAEQGWITGGGDDTLNGGAGNDILSGGDGVDTIVYAGKQAGYHILVGRDGVVKVQDTANGDLDTLRGIERAQFSDGSADIAFTQAPAASLKVLGLLYQTTLDRASDVAGLKYWIETGLQGQTLVQTFTGAPEYIARYGNTSDAQFVHALFQNSGLQGQAAGGEQAWVDYLASHSRVELIGSWIANTDVQAAQFGSDGVWLA
ncbi:MAG: DUF4214 domain-containing protein, partial [Burkholderiaceae bacterium]|nr:DUF4214 domain-containing protein [Burkholderiaceae bacterium]